MSNTSQPRYAVYYAPPRDGGLWRLAQTWLGRDCESGEVLAQPALKGWSAAEIAAATKSPRHYGFHATLKAPFRLAAGTSLRNLHDAVGAFAARQRPFLVPKLKVSAIGPFLALTLSAPSPAMEALAAHAVRDLDHLRDPLNGVELQRRLTGDLTPRQQELLRTWGYPYVLEEFRFHMTLTGPLADPDQRQRLQTLLATLFQPELTEPVPARELCLYSQDAAEVPFALVDRFRLGTAPSRRAKAAQCRA